MHRLLWILALLVVTGCPGLKRPPPSAQPSQPAAGVSPTTAAESLPPEVPDVTPPPGVDSFERGVAKIRAAYAGFLERPTDHAHWNAVVDDLQRVEDEGFALLDTTQDPRVEDLLLELGDLRASLSEREP